MRDEREMFGLEGNPEEIWKKTMDRFYNAVQIQVSAKDTAIAFISIFKIAKEFFAQKYMLMHLEELMNNTSEGEIENKVKQLSIQGMQMAFSEPRIQKLFVSRNVSEYLLDDVADKVEQGMRQNRAVECPKCHTRYPIINGFNYKICAICAICTLSI